MDTFLNCALPGLSLGFVYALIALGFVLIYKCTGIFNLALGEMVMFGAYVLFAVSVMAKLPLGLGIVITLVIGIAFGWLIERLLTRPLIGQPLLALLMMTLCLGSILTGVMILGWGSSCLTLPGMFPSGGVYIAGTMVSWCYFAFIAVSVALLGALLYFFRYSRLGLSMMAISEDQQAAQSLGISVNTIVRASWIIGVLVATIGGILLTQITSAHYTQTGIGFIAIAVALLGGLESIPGVIIGGIAVGLIQGLCGGYIDPLVPGSFAEVSIFLVMLLVLLVRPYGLFGWERIERV
jgi:branched-chain amino acid transport system permease protein